jgi:hypothetical protein
MLAGYEAAGILPGICASINDPRNHFIWRRLIRDERPELLDFPPLDPARPAYSQLDKMFLIRALRPDRLYFVADRRDPGFPKCTNCNQPSHSRTLKIGNICLKQDLSGPILCLETTSCPFRIFIKVL